MTAAEGSPPAARKKPPRTVAANKSGTATAAPTTPAMINVVAKVRPRPSRARRPPAPEKCNAASAAIINSAAATAEIWRAVV